MPITQEFDNSPRVSVIMPVYNTGEQLYKTLMSLMAQTEKNFEVIIIDDCSEDALTKEIEQTFCRFDARFKLISQEKNTGAANCRNSGIEYVNGQYLMFLDSDDLFVDSMLKDMADTLDEFQADVCVLNFTMYDVKNDLVSPIIIFEEDGITKEVFSMDQLGEKGLSLWMPTPWNKMFNAEFVRSNDLKFQNLTNCNDMYFGYASVLMAERICLCRNKDPLLIYNVNNPKQISYTMDSRNMTTAFSALFELAENLGEMAIKQLILELMSILVPMLSRCPVEQYNIETKDIAKDLVKKYSEGIRFKGETAERIQMFISPPE
jgi:glycosyltransferase involved in cell wall biosynthesis